ncbi:sensor histidine kinase [Streptomyces sp. TS71-3]|uniref:sensor histidine kinase n=1 Tax=Streptomyces sp. TS71-3 TaxID=2733862 RepID=UPI001BB30370|nr:sensor histidine kinase [Streptomyces sp. TS71-3]
MMGRPPRNRRQAYSKMLWIGIWLAFLGAPVEDLLSGGHTIGFRFWGWTGLAAFVALYLRLVFRQISRGNEGRTVWTILAALFVIATTLSLALDTEWLVLYVYVAVACGAALRLPLAAWAVLGLTCVLVAVGLATGGADAGFAPGLLIPALIGGFAMTGVRQLVLTTVELRRARATVAHLAANEERLRLARDLHDLLGHSLSLITLKSELAGRMLPAEPEQAAQQVKDIEDVSRQALVDVREAVSGYRRPRLLGELAGAQVALTAAGITPVVPAEGEPLLPDGLPEERESALAWSLREAVTNVVRHGGARRCAIELVTRQTLDGSFLDLVVEDDGVGGTALPGNGLTGLTERLVAVGGSLETTSGRRSGFRLRARVPLGAPSVGGEPVGSGA